MAVQVPEANPNRSRGRDRPMAVPPSVDSEQGLPLGLGKKSDAAGGVVAPGYYALSAVILVATLMTFL